MSEEHGVAGGPRHHAEDGQPQVRQVLWRESSVTDTEHVGHGLEQGPRVLLEPPLVLLALLVKSLYRQTGHLKLIDVDPRVVRESLKHRDKELEAAGPVADQEHHADQVEDPHEERHRLQDLKG